MEWFSHENLNRCVRIVFKLSWLCHSCLKTNSDMSAEARVAKDSDGKSYTHTPAVHGKSHTDSKYLQHNWMKSGKHPCQDWFVTIQKILRKFNHWPWNYTKQNGKVPIYICFDIPTDCWSCFNQRFIACYR